MHIKMIVLSTAMLLFTIIYSVKYINWEKKREVVVKYQSDSEIYALIGICLLIFNLLPGKEINKQAVFNFFVIVIIFFAVILYLIISRKKDKKFTILFCASEVIYEKILFDSLNKHNIPYSNNGYCISIKGTTSSVVFYKRGFVIKDYKVIPKHNDFLLDLERNIKASPAISNKKGEVANIIICAITTLLIIVETIVLHIFY